MQRRRCLNLWLAVKRLIDLAASLIAIAILSPFLILIGTLVKLSSRGPVFYRGLRTGIHGSQFYIYKFRTMVVDAEMLGGPTTGSNDPRVTRIGAFLRKTKMDELPQFLNILKGDMSLIGPRPEVPQYTSLYSDSERIILSMRPGLTDFASIQFANLDDIVGNTDPDKFYRENILPVKNQLRMKYVQEWSLKTDFYLLCATALRVFRRMISH